MFNLFEEARRIVFNRKISLGIANVAVINSWDNLPDPMEFCPHCGEKFLKKKFWQWFRSYYNSLGYDLSKEESKVSIRSSLMYAAISNKCEGCGEIIRTKDNKKGVERFDKRKAYESIFI